MQPQTANPANPFSNPIAPGGGEKAPRPRDMVGSLVAYSPRIFTAAGAPGNTTGVGGSEPRDRVTADLIILETAGPVFFGGSPEYEREPKPHTHVLNAGPARFTGVWVSASNIVKALAPGGQPLVGSMLLGRIVRSEIGNRPFNLVSVEGTPDMQKAVDIYSRISMGALAYVEPTPLNGGVPAAANSVSYAPPAAAVVPQPQQTPAQEWRQATLASMASAPPVDPAYAAWQAQQAAAQAPAPVAPTAPPVDPAYAAWQAQQAALAAAANVAASFPGAAQVVSGYPVPPATSATAPAGPPPPAGWSAAGWDSLNAQQKDEVLRSIGAPR